MKPTITIIQYLYSGRNTWLRCCEGCECDIDERIKNALDQVPVDYWLKVTSDVTDAYGTLIRNTADTWNEICGPKAEAQVLNDAVEQYMGKAAELMALIATKERLSSE